MSTIAHVKQQVERIWLATFQSDLTDTLAAHLRRLKRLKQPDHH